MNQNAFASIKQALHQLIYYLATIVMNNYKMTFKVSADYLLENS